MFLKRAIPTPLSTKTRTAAPAAGSHFRSLDSSGSVSSTSKCFQLSVVFMDYSSRPNEPYLTSF
jgi:hypothetical protein